MAYHLTDPKTGGFLEFALDLLITALVQNYRSGEPSAPRWLPAALTGVAGVIIGAILIAAIAQPGSAAGTSYTNGMPTAHMSAGDFDQASVTIAKDARLFLVDDVAVPPR